MNTIFKLIALVLNTNIILNVTCYISTGAKVLKQRVATGNRATVNIASLISGVYLLEVTAANQTKRYKVINQ